ncbi:MAG TPA: hypothetical protein VHV32_19380 [Candidatus Angelobacter sp.]|nr:hypothetical protein [Candidatus Angelobacter sp.]
MRKPRFNDKEEITSWDLIAVLCGTHKKEQEEIPENKTMRFDFVGAVACL